MNVTTWLLIIMIVLIVAMLLYLGITLHKVLTTSNSDSEEELQYSILKCNNCGYEWVGVWPKEADSSQLECNRCHEFNCRKIWYEPKTDIEQPKYCVNCNCLQNIDPDDGMLFRCELSNQVCFIDDLPLTYMSKCPINKRTRRGDGDGSRKSTD